MARRQVALRACVNIVEAGDYKTAMQMLRDGEGIYAWRKSWRNAPLQKDGFCINYLALYLGEGGVVLYTASSCAGFWEKMRCNHPELSDAKDNDWVVGGN